MQQIHRFLVFKFKESENSSSMLLKSEHVHLCFCDSPSVGVIKFNFVATASDGLFRRLMPSWYVPVFVELIKK